MHLQYVSDIHQNFFLTEANPKYDKKAALTAAALREMLWFPEVAGDRLIILGDTWEGDKLFQYGPEHYSWMADIAKQYEKVYLILGNHDTYGSYPKRMLEKWHTHVTEQNLTNVVILDNKGVALTPYVHLWGGTMWTNLRQLSPSDVSLLTETNGFQQKPLFTDFSAIKRSASQRMRPSDWQSWHDFAAMAMKNYLDQHQHVSTIVATHMPLLEQSANNAICYLGEDYAAAERAMETSNYEKVLQLYNVPLHLHGHIHQVLDYSCNNLQVKANPLGYCGTTQKGKDPNSLLPFDPTAKIRVENYEM